MTIFGPRRLWAPATAAEILPFPLNNTFEARRMEVEAMSEIHRGNGGRGAVGGDPGPAAASGEASSREGASRDIGSPPSVAKGGAGTPSAAKGSRSESGGSSNAASHGHAEEEEHDGDEGEVGQQDRSSHTHSPSFASGSTLSDHSSVSGSPSTSSTPPPVHHEHHHIGLVSFGDAAAEVDWLGRNVYVRSLPPLNALTMEMPNEVHIYHMFSRFGEIERVRVVRDPYTQQPIGIAMVLFRHAAAARLAIDAVNGATFGAFATLWLPKVVLHDPAFRAQMQQGWAVRVEAVAGEEGAGAVAEEGALLDGEEVGTTKV